MLSALPTTMARASGAAPIPQESALQEVLAKARYAITCGYADVAVCSLSVAVGGDSPVFHDALLNLLDSAPGRMRQHLVDEARSQRPDFVLDAHDRQGKTALDLAVRHNDREFADYLLCHGANPERISLFGATPDMRTRVTRWRLRNLLYADRGEPSQRSGRLSSSFNRMCAESVHEKWTPLDHALSKGDYNEADKLLQQEMGGNSMNPHADLWYGAMEKKRHDVLRAMLILRPDDLGKLARNNNNKNQTVGKWLDEVRQDPGLTAALKELPYQSAKRGTPVNLNCEVPFRSKNELIECRHLATYHQEEQAREPKIKFDYRKFGSREGIATNVQPGIEERSNELGAQASATHLIANSKFGQFLAGQFREMEEEAKPATRLMLLTSTHHMMNLGLMIKEKEGKKSYVVKFFDPNITTTGTRSKASSAQIFERQTIEDYLAEEEDRGFYYPEAKGLSMIFVRPREGERAGVAASTEGRRLTTCINIEEVDATAVWYFMAHGFTANLRDLQAHLGTLSEEKRIAWLTGKGINGTSGLYAAMQEGHPEAVELYNLMLQAALPGQEHKQKRIELLEGMNDQGNPALSSAMANGHPDAVKVYCKVILQEKSLSAQERIRLLEGKNAVGFPALSTAMYYGHPDTVMEYGKEILQEKTLQADEKADLLLAKVTTGKFAGDNGFRVAMDRDHFGTANAQLKLLLQLAPHLSKGKRAELQKELQAYGALITDKSKMGVSDHQVRDFRILRATLSKLKAELRGHDFFFAFCRGGKTLVIRHSSIFG